jgi:hypothetical protein
MANSHCTNLLFIFSERLFMHRINFVNKVLEKSGCCSRWAGWKDEELEAAETVSKNINRFHSIELEGWFILACGIQKFIKGFCTIRQQVSPSQPTSRSDFPFAKPLNILECSSCPRNHFVILSRRSFTITLKKKRFVYALFMCLVIVWNFSHFKQKLREDLKVLKYVLQSDF